MFSAIKHLILFLKALKLLHHVTLLSKVFQWLAAAAKKLTISQLRLKH